ncbi:MAG: hypothetical protein IT342_04375 [Candidatus Melainabacteria bacterium]|nr:hypothetical protein [Candidatus Melainabacteria bacterium]
MSLRDELKSAAANAAGRQQAEDDELKAAAAAEMNKLADEAYERLTRRMKKAPVQKRWRFEDKVTPAVAELLKKRFNKEGYLVIFRFFSIEIIDDDQQ